MNRIPVILMREISTVHQTSPLCWFSASNDEMRSEIFRWLSLEVCCCRGRRESVTRLKKCHPPENLFLALSPPSTGKALHGFANVLIIKTKRSIFLKDDDRFFPAAFASMTVYHGFSLELFFASSTIKEFVFSPC